VQQPQRQNEGTKDMTDQYPPPGGQPPYQQYGPPPGWQPQPPRKRKHTLRNVLLGIGGAFVLIIVIAAVAGGGNNTSASSNPNTPSAPVVDNSPVPVTTTTPPPAPQYTAGEQQALDAAEGYLSDGQGFSKAGLISQLHSLDGNGFSRHLAEFAVSHVHVNWRDQAVIAAKGYMSDGEGFSYEGLVQQLDSPDGSQFTQAQAEYAAKKVGL
jgi:hypothetical protein